MLNESYIIRFKDFVGTLVSVIDSLYQDGYIKKRTDGTEEIYYIDEEGAKADEQIKRVIDKGVLFAHYEILDNDLDIYDDDTDDPYDCFDGSIIGEAASSEVRFNLYNINPFI